MSSMMGMERGLIRRGVLVTLGEKGVFHRICCSRDGAAVDAGWLAGD